MATSKEAKITKGDEIVDALLSLKCPYFNGDVATSLNPGAARNRILTWCIEVMHPNLVEYGRVNITKLTKVMAALGLCKDSDVGLVQGVTHKRQSEFLLALFHLTATKTANTDEVCRGRVAVNHICLREGLDEILPSSISLIPPTVKVSERKQKAPTLVQLERQQAQLVQELNEIQEKLDSSFSQDNLQAVKIKSKSFPVVLGTLEQQLTAFSHAFEQEFRPYVTSVPLPLSDVGINCKRLSEQVTSLKTTLDHLQQLEHSRSKS